jgi:hypothetical protein|tara:strand:- start:1483 stop:1761 length:279 start_codon:yes stop_codon:yes gene_type:complete
MPNNFVASISPENAAQIAATKHTSNPITIRCGCLTNFLSFQRAHVFADGSIFTFNKIKSDKNYHNSVYSINLFKPTETSKSKYKGRRNGFRK